MHTDEEEAEDVGVELEVAPTVAAVLLPVSAVVGEVVFVEGDTEVAGVATTAITAGGELVKLEFAVLTLPPSFVWTAG